MFKEDKVGEIDMELWERNLEVKMKKNVIMEEEMNKEMKEDKEGMVVNIIEKRVWKINKKLF